jgi:hypothetical protein
MTEGHNSFPAFQSREKAAPTTGSLNYSYCLSSQEIKKAGTIKE